MLEYLRNAADKPVAKVLIGILAFSFVGWGVAEWIFGGVTSDNALVRVGGEKITINQYNNARSHELAQMDKEQQRAIYTDAAAGREFSNKIMARLSTEAMSEQHARNLGFVVSDHRIAREIRELPEFQQDGKFSPIMFDIIMSQGGYSEADLANALRAQDLRTMLLGGLNVAIPVPNFAVDAAYNARYGMRNIEYAMVKYSDFKTDTPSAEQLRDFYAQNPQRIAETRTVSYVLVPAEMNKPDAYEAALTTAQRLEDDIISGDTLSDAAKKHNAKYVSLGDFAAAGRPVDTILTDSMIAKIFAMDEGTESELTETAQGFVIVRVEKITPEHNAEFDAAKDTITNDWQRSEQRKQAYVRANELLSNAKKEEKVAGSVSQKISRTSGASLKLLAAAYAANVGDTIIVEDDNAFYVMRINSAELPSDDASKKAALRKEIEDGIVRTVSDDYNSFLGRQYPVKVNKKVYDKVFAQ